MSNGIDKEYGQAPSNASAEIVHLIGHYTLAFKPGETLGTYEIMPRTKLGKPYQNHNLQDLADYTNSKLVGIRAIPYVAFAERGATEPAAITEAYFFHHTMVKVRKNSKEMDEFSLAQLMPYTVVQKGGQSTFELITKNQDYMRLSGIDIPDGDFVIELIAASNLVVAAASGASPLLHNHNNANASDQAYWVKFEFLGQSKRRLS